MIKILKISWTVKNVFYLDKYNYKKDCNVIMKKIAQNNSKKQSIISMVIDT